MTPDEVRQRVAEIERDVSRGVDEAAHIAEDSLHQDVLAAIADGKCDDPAVCAAEALKTRRLSFSRWYG